MYGSPSSHSGGVDDAMSIGESCDDTDAVDALERLGERWIGVWPVCECVCVCVSGEDCAQSWRTRARRIVAPMFVPQNWEAGLRGSVRVRSEY